MTPEDKSLIRESWSRVAPMADAAAALFYDRLFQIDPELRPLFAHTDMPAQRERLVKALGAVVASLDDLGAVVPILEAIGRRHADYRVEDTHYDTVGEALLWTLEKGLGAAWTDEARAAWTEAYGIVAGVMRKATADARLH